MSEKKKKSPDWNKIKSEYIITNTSYRKLSEKYKIPFNTLSYNARSENWPEQKKRYCDKLDTKIIETAGNNEAKAIEEMKEKERQKFEEMEQIIWRAISTRTKKGFSIKEDLTPLDVDRFMSAQIKLQTIKYRSYGIADKHELGGLGGNLIGLEIVLVEAK